MDGLTRTSASEKYEILRVVYPAFDLTPEEIALIETSTKCPDGAVQPLPSIAVVSSRPPPDARLAEVSEIPRIPTRLNAARLKLGVQSITSSLIIGDANKSGDHGGIQPERQTATTAAGARSGTEAGQDRVRVAGHAWRTLHRHFWQRKINLRLLGWHQANHRDFDQLVDQGFLQVSHHNPQGQPVRYHLNHEAIIQVVETGFLLPSPLAD
ncbi:MAG: hypothetical protein IPO91_02860 [Chloroflexi bacterium]|nr:hypothetical protein [Chloroflexota bacterium]